MRICRARLFTHHTGCDNLIAEDDPDFLHIVVRSFAKWDFMHIVVITEGQWNGVDGTGRPGAFCCVEKVMCCRRRECQFLAEDIFLR